MLQKPKFFSSSGPIISIESKPFASKKLNCPDNLCNRDNFAIAKSPTTFERAANSSKEKSFAESDTPFFRNKLKELKKNFSKRIREYKGYFNKGGEEGIIKKKWGRIFNYYANLDLIDKDSTNEKIVTYYYRGHVYWGAKI